MVVGGGGYILVGGGWWWMVAYFSLTHDTICTNELIMTLTFNYLQVHPS